jgi:hypothetical protein
VEECEIRGGEYVAYDRADYATALKVWLPQAEGGDGNAEVYVGEIYEKGLGTAPDYARAAAWYEKAAVAGSPQGKIHLAYLYEQGLGVQRDAARAANLYRAASGLTTDRLIFASELDARVGEFTVQLEERAREVQELSGEQDRARSELDKQRSAASKAQRLVSALRIKLKRSQSEATSAASAKELAGLREQLAAQEQELKEQQQRIASLEQSAAQKEALLSQRLADSQQQANRLKADLGPAQAATTRSQLIAAQARSSALEQEAAEAREEAARLELAVQKARGARAASAAQQSALAASQRALKRQQAVARDLDEERVQLQEEVKRLQNSLRGAGSHQETVQASTAARAQAAGLELERVARGRDIHDLSAHEQRDAIAVAEARQRLTEAEKRPGVQEETLQKLSSELQDLETRLLKERARLKGLQAASQADQGKGDDLHAQLTKGEPASAPAAMASPSATGGVGASGLGLGTSFALIIANARYQDGRYTPLPAVEKDAAAVDRALQKYGFKDHIRLVKNGTRDQMMNDLVAFGRQLGPSDSALIYYTGHGTVVDRSNTTYWLPSDADPGNQASWVSTGWVTEIIGQMRARHILVVVDSCYAGALVHATNFRLASTSVAAEPERIRALAQLPSRTVLTSGGNEPVAGDGPGGSSVFARQFAGILERNTQVLDASALYDALADAMSQPVTDALASAATSSQQLPRYSVLANTGHLNGDFLFVPAGNGGPGS